MTLILNPDIEKLEAAYHKRCETSFLAFARGTTIASATGPRMLAGCMANYQWECLEQLAPSLEAVQRGLPPPSRRFWIERTKKASKDADMGLSLLWVVAFPQKPIYIQVGAADRDQANIVKNRIKDLIYYNPWLNDYVEIRNYSVRNKKGLAEIDIVAADVGGSHGATPDILFINELSHITKWEFIENLLDNANGVPQGLVIVATNAGFKNSEAFALRKTVEKNSNWKMFIWSRPAPWITKADLKEASERNPPSRFNRLWYGKWASGKGDALSEKNIDDIFVPNMRPLIGPEPGYQYIAGLDLGISHDHAGLVVVGVHSQKRKIRVAIMKGWEPTIRPNGDLEVDLMDVENTCLAFSRAYRLEWLGYDPHQAKLMAQRLYLKNVPVREVPFVGKNLTEMATALKTVVETGLLHSYEDQEHRLRKDLGKLSIVEKAYGLKLEAVSDKDGHADVGTALVICLPKAIEILSGRYGLDPDATLAYDDLDPLSRKEVEQLPQELKDIYASAGPMDEELDLDGDLIQLDDPLPLEDLD